MKKLFYCAPELKTFKFNVSRTYMLAGSDAETAEAIAEGIIDGGDD